MTVRLTYAPGGLSREEAAAYIGGVSVRKLDELQAQGRIVPVALDGRRVYLREHLDAFLASLPEWGDRDRATA